MRITIDIKPEVHAEFTRQAASSGKSVEDHAASLLEEAVLRRVPLTGKTLEGVFAPVLGSSDDGELDLSRNPSTGRPIDLS